jgi:hypothetical protein
MIYGGLVVVIAYSSGADIDNSEYLITQSELDILTQSPSRILVQE